MPIILILLLVTIAVKAQQNAFTGKWRLDLPATVALMDHPMKQKFDSLDATMKDRAEASMGSRTFTFTSDSVYVEWRASGQEKKSAGTWSYDTSSGELIIAMGKDQQRFAVEFKPGGALVLINKKPFGYFSSLCLIKS